MDRRSSGARHFSIDEPLRGTHPSSWKEEAGLPLDSRSEVVVVRECHREFGQKLCHVVDVG